MALAGAAGDATGSSVLCLERRDAPDSHWRLVSFPYYVKYLQGGSFKHIDLNIPEFLESGRGGNTVQTAISIDNETKNRCTTVIPGFHDNLREWWKEVEDRGMATSGPVHDLKDIYLKKDEKKYGKFVPMKCKRGDVRLTLSQLAYGSRGNSLDQRRVVHPCLVEVDSDHKRAGNGL